MTAIVPHGFAVTVGIQVSELKRHELTASRPQKKPLGPAAVIPRPLKSEYEVSYPTMIPP